MNNRRERASLSAVPPVHVSVAGACPILDVMVEAWKTVEVDAQSNAPERKYLKRAATDLRVLLGMTQAAPVGLWRVLTLLDVVCRELLPLWLDDQGTEAPPADDKTVANALRAWPKIETVEAVAIAKARLTVPYRTVADCYALFRQRRIRSLVNPLYFAYEAATAIVENKGLVEAASLAATVFVCAAEMGVNVAPMAQRVFAELLAPSRTIVAG